MVVLLVTVFILLNFKYFVTPLLTAYFPFSNLELILYLSDKGHIKSKPVKSVMFQVNRANFVPATESHPYADVTHYLGHGAVMSAPYLHAIILERLSLYLKGGDKILHVGCGSGYLTTCMAAMIGKRGCIIGIDHIPELVEVAVKNVEKDKPGYLDTERIKLIVGDGSKGLPSEGPFNAIYVAAAVQEIPPELVDQLKVGSRMIIPLISRRLKNTQTLYEIDKQEDSCTRRKINIFINYTPLLIGD